MLLKGMNQEDEDVNESSYISDDNSVVGGLSVQLTPRCKGGSSD